MNKFKVVYGKEEVEDIIAYNDIMNYIQREHNKEDGTLWKFRRIVAHQGPLTHRHLNYKGFVCIMSALNGKMERPPTNRYQ